MDLRSIVLVALLIGSAWNGWHQWSLRAVHPQDGPIAPEEPLQTNIDRAPPIRIGRWTLTPRASYDITARILGREDYRFDALASLIPEDLALGWGPMSDNRVLADFEISQGARFYSWRPRASCPYPGKRSSPIARIRMSCRSTAISRRSSPGCVWARSCTSPASW